jgi:uncharacterized protein YukE
MSLFSIRTSKFAFHIARPVSGIRAASVDGGMWEKSRFFNSTSRNLSNNPSGPKESSNKPKFGRFGIAEVVTYGTPIAGVMYKVKSYFDGKFEDNMRTSKDDNAALKNALEADMSNNKADWKREITALNNTFNDKMNGFNDKMNGFNEKMINNSAEMKGEIAELNNSFNDKMNGFNDKMNGFYTKMNDYDSKVNDFTKDVIAVQRGINNIDQQISHLTNDIADVKVDIVSLKNDIEKRNLKQME